MAGKYESPQKRKGSVPILVPIPLFCAALSAALFPAASCRTGEAGYDMVLTASSHASDTYAGGILRTLEQCLSQLGR